MIYNNTDNKNAVAADRIILASKSPRRSEILSQMGINFEIVTAPTDETSDITDPEALVRELAARKGKAVRKILVERGEFGDKTLIVSADTVVECGGEIMGKPKNDDDAKRMLRKLSGTTHSVISGIAIFFGSKFKTVSERTYVTFAGMTEENVNDYVASGEPSDKAGAYAVQGKAALFIEGINGDYFNVVGLPIHRLYRLALDEFGVDLTKTGEEKDA